MNPSQPVQRRRVTWAPEQPRPKRSHNINVGDCVVSPWNTYGTVYDIFICKHTKKEIFMVNYYKKDLPNEWQWKTAGLGTNALKSPAYEIVKIGHSINQIHRWV